MNVSIKTNKFVLHEESTAKSTSIVAKTSPGRIQEQTSFVSNISPSLSEYPNKVMNGESPNLHAISLKMRSPQERIRENILSLSYTYDSPKLHYHHKGRYFSPTQSHYSSSCISRSTLRYKLKNQRKSQRKFFRNTM